MEVISINVAPGVETALAYALDGNKHILPGVTLGEITQDAGVVDIEVFGLEGQDLSALTAKIRRVARDNGLAQYIKN